jgi:hypothetical protein
MERIFNIIFIASLISLFAARLFYAFSNTKIFANPLIFILFPYFPGLSLLGGIFGVGGYLLFLKIRKENALPVARISDFFSIAFLISLPVGFLGALLFSKNTLMLKPGALAVAYLIQFIIFIRYFLPRLLNGKFKEGTITYLFLIFFSVTSLISNVFPKFNIHGYLANYENIILLLLLLASVGTLIYLKKRK